MTSDNPSTLRLYTGQLYKQFLIDRVAFGLTYDDIAPQFKQTFGIDLAQTDMLQMLDGCDEEIRAREQQMLEAYTKEGDLRQQLIGLSGEIRELLDKVKRTGDYDILTKLLSVYIKQLTEGIRIIDQFRSRVERTVEKSDSTNILKSIEFLQNEDVLKIVDSKKLCQLLGIKKKRKEVTT